MARPRRRTKGWTGGTPSGIPQKLRLQIFERDNYTCRLQFPDRCIAMTPQPPEVLQVDHIKNLASLGLPRGHNDPDGLATVCVPCHRKKTSNEGLAAQGKLKTKRVMPNAAGFIPGQYDYSDEERKAAQKKAEMLERARLRNEEMERLVAEWNANRDGEES